MQNRLMPIVSQKKQEVAALYELIAQQPTHAIHQLLKGEVQGETNTRFTQALTQPQLAVIAEIKRKSPSKGALAAIADPIQLADKYIQGGANVLSILTDEHFFGGHLDDLIKVKQYFGASCPPILRKDFTIDEIQIAEAVIAGADAILCIVAIHQEKTAAILQAAKKMNIEVLVEVHDRAELDIALACGATIIGINNRNLNTFKVDLETAIKLKPFIPPHIITVAESGIEQTAQAQQYFKAGFNAVLIGESLVKANHPEQFIQDCQHG